MFPHEKWGKNTGDYGSDFRNRKKADKWLFEIRSDATDRDVNLCWQGAAKVLERSELIDRDTRQIYFPDEMGCISINMDEKVRSFRWDYLAK